MAIGNTINGKYVYSNNQLRHTHTPLELQCPPFFLNQRQCAAHAE